MVREILPEEIELVYRFAERDVARNYFILLGLSSKKQTYTKIYGEFKKDELIAILLKRRSGLLQFYGPGDFDQEAFKRIIQDLDHKGLIGPESYCSKLFDEDLFEFEKNGAYISKLHRDSKIHLDNLKYRTKKLGVEDLDRIVDLYKDSFSSFSSKEVMEDKLNTGRGRGYYIEKEDEIISVCQSDFETLEAAVIVGVATKKELRHRGLASQCLKRLICDLLEEGKDLYLQYDNLEAGKIYERLGFKVVDRVIHLRAKES